LWRVILFFIMTKQEKIALQQQNKTKQNKTMKKQTQRVVLLAVCSLFFYAGNAQVKIGDNPTTIDTSAMLDVESTTQGFLPPRMSTTQINAITLPATGLMVYNTTIPCLQVNDGTLTSPSWNCISGLAGVPVDSVGSIASLACAGATHNGTLDSGQVASGVSSVISYTGGNGNAHIGQSVASTGVTGLTATLASGSFATGAGTLTYTITGTPADSGTASFAINIGGQTCTLTRTINTYSVGYPGAPTVCASDTISATSCSNVSGATANDDAGTTLGTEYNWTGATTSGMANTSTTRALVDISGQCWMRYDMDTIPSNYSPSPTWSSTDVGWSGYYTAGPFTNEGLLYQWSAAMNGSTAERAQGVCPTDWHVPSDCEWMYLENNLGMSTADQGSSSSWRNSGSVGSKLSTATSSGNNNSGFTALLAGLRNSLGAVDYRGSSGLWWSSSETSATNAQLRYLYGSQAGVLRSSYNKAFGFSVRCLKD
jgi:uncharacterized protein (TIGR02145 family)